MTVNQAPLVVTASSASMTYGGSAPAITASYSGFVNGDTSSSLTTQPTCTTTARSSSPVGGYPSTCSGAADPNYSITYAAGSVNVDPAPLSVVASSGTMTYGASAPAITASYSGFVNGDTSSSLITQPTCSTAATSSSPVGNYASSCTGAADANYSITDVNGMVAVGAAPLVITASSGSTTYGTAPGAVTASYSGFVNGDSAASLTTQPSCTTAAGASSTVGSYPTSCIGAADANYSISYVNGAETVAPAPLTITASSEMETYGSAPGGITATVSGLENGESSDVLGNALTCSTTASASSPVGSYGTSCAGAVDSNYVISYVGGSVTVTPAPISITASSGTSTYGGDVPTITPTVSGLQNGENVAVLGAGADLHHGSHQRQLGRHLRLVVFGGGRRQLLDQLHRRLGHRRPRRAHDHRVLGRR